MQDAFGSRGTDFAETELHRFITASRLKDGKVDPVRLNAFLAVVDGVRPSNEMEAMLASQMAITHGFAMDLMQVARSADKIPQFESAGHMVAKLLRAFATHAELLHKMKRGGEQRVRVEHVHVHHGGQAIVGNVSPGRTGIEKIENQPHAPQTDAEDQPRSLTSEQGTPMPRPYPEREPVPLTVRKGQEPVPHARRRAR